MENEHYVFHLDYINSPSFLAWDELDCLSKALGYPQTVLRRLCEASPTKTESGVSTEDFKEICKSTEFNETINYGYNQHSFEWNRDAIFASVYIISHHGLSFDEVRNIRLAYTFYEAIDGKGLPIDEMTLLMCLKVCGRVISPKKMMHRIKHMKSGYREEGHMEMSDFLELILWCDVYTACEAKVKKCEMARGKNQRLLWNLNDFMEVLDRTDTKIHDLLDRQYIKEEWTFIREKLNKCDKLLHPPVVSPEPRLIQAKHSRESYAPLKLVLRQSEFDAQRSRARGYYHEDRPKTAPSFLQHIRKEREVERARRAGATVRRKRPRTAKELVNHYLDEGESGVETGASRDKLEACRPSPTRQRPHTAPLVNSEEQDEMEKSKEEIRFEMATVAERYSQATRQDLEYLFPGFWTRAARRPKPKPPTPPKPPRLRRKQCPSPEFLRRIASANPREPSLLHGKACDARHHGLNSPLGSQMLQIKPMELHSTSKAEKKSSSVDRSLSIVKPSQNNLSALDKVDTLLYASRFSARFARSCNFYKEPLTGKQVGDESDSTSNKEKLKAFLNDSFKQRTGPSLFVRGSRGFGEYIE